MRIKQVAAALDTSVDTLKRLERRGLLKPVRDRAGHRRYTQQDVNIARSLLFPADVQMSGSPSRATPPTAPLKPVRSSRLS
jgi:DNA-binding transcriptional MerR regulator